MASNINHIKKIIQNVTESNLFSLEINKILLNYLNQIKNIVSEINKTSTENIKDSYKTFGTYSWQIYNIIQDYNKFISRILFNNTKESDNYKIVEAKIYQLNDMSLIIPNEDNASLIRTRNGEDDTYNFIFKPITISETHENVNPHIFILPGCFELSQTLDRVKLFENLITKFFNEGKITSHIIVSGRGNGTGFNKDANFLFDIQRQTDTDINKRFVKIDNFDKNNIEHLIKYGELNNDNYKNTGYTHFKTEAYYMAIEVSRILKELYKDNTKPKPIILLEPLAGETAANFVLSPFSCFYEYNDDDSITNNRTDTTISDDDKVSIFFNTLLVNNLHIISHDYHILRCINTSMQTLRPSLETAIFDNSQYGNINYYLVKDDASTKKMFANNYFNSFTQPYMQLFFDMFSIKTGDMDYKDSNTIMYERTTKNIGPNGTPYNYLFQLVIRLLTYHGAYTNLTNPTPESAAGGYVFSNLICSIYPNILKCNIEKDVWVGGYLNSKNKTRKHKTRKTKTHKNKTHKNKKY